MPPAANVSRGIGATATKNVLAVLACAAILFVAIAQVHVTSAAGRDYVLGAPAAAVDNAWQTVWNPVNERIVFSAYVTSSPNSMVFAWDPRTGDMLWIAGDGTAGHAVNADGHLARYDGGNGITLSVSSTTGDILGYQMSLYAIHLIVFVNMNAPYAYSAAAGVANVGGMVNGAGNVARFNTPYQLCHARGTFRKSIVADRNTHRFRELSGASSILTAATIAGDGVNSYVDGSALTARFSFPFGCVMLPSSAATPTAAFLTENSEVRVRRLAPVSSAGTVSTVFRVVGGTNPGQGITAHEEVDGYITLLLAHTTPGVYSLRFHVGSILDSSTTWPSRSVPGSWAGTNALHVLPNGTIFATRTGTPTIRVFPRGDYFLGTGTATIKPRTPSRSITLPSQTALRTKSKSKSAMRSMSFSESKTRRLPTSAAPTPPPLRVVPPAPAPSSTSIAAIVVASVCGAVVLVLAVLVVLYFAYQPFRSCVKGEEDPEAAAAAAAAAATAKAAALAPQGDAGATPAPKPTQVEDRAAHADLPKIIT